jgi:drug/metabolite transporter (DMT)-like permease
MRWLLVFIVISATCASDLLQSWAGKRQGEVSSAGALGRLLRQWPVLLAIGCMAVSFGAFLLLLRIADLSFAVPVTAAAIVLETLAARIVLGERVAPRRWLGSTLVAAGVWLLARS